MPIKTATPTHPSASIAPDSVASVGNAATINNVSIPLLLDWWQQHKRIASVRSNISATLLKGDETYLQAYYRLMEIYSVVKSGGVQAQTEAVKAFAQREACLLNQRLHEIDATAELAEAVKREEREKVEQELQELHSANNWRMKTLTNIAPEEEATVRQYLPIIEKTLMQTRA